MSDTTPNDTKKPSSSKRLDMLGSGVSALALMADITLGHTIAGIGAGALCIGFGLAAYGAEKKNLSRTFNVAVDGVLTAGFAAFCVHYALQGDIFLGTLSGAAALVMGYGAIKPPKP